MGFQKVEVMAEELRLDPDNPRLWNSQLENREDQGEIARELAGQTGASSILDDMLDGCYIAPEPFLGIRSPGGFTVVDGNKRNVCALEIARGGIFPPEATSDWRAGTRTKGTDSKTAKEIAASITTPEIVIFDSWEEAHRIRVRRQKANRSQWNLLITAQDLRRMRILGSTPREAGAFYGYSKRNRGEEWAQRMTNSLNIWEQVVQGRDSYIWNTSTGFGRLHQALRGPNVRAKLGLRPPESYEPEDKPLEEETLRLARRLMTHISGKSKDEDGEPENHRIETDQDITALEEIYGDDRAYETLERSHHNSAKQVLDRMRGHQNHWEVKRTLEIIEGVAKESLLKVKQGWVETELSPNRVHVSRATYSLNGDQSSQYAVYLSGRGDAEKEAGARDLRKALKKEGFTDCLVELE